MIQNIKHFVKGIDTSALIPMAAFVSVVAFVFWPLRTVSDTASLPCAMLAKSFCMFVIGCYIAEVLKSRISKNALKYIAVLGVLFCLHIIVVDGIASLHDAPPVSIHWFPEAYVRTAEVSPFFICLGIVVNHHSENMPERPCWFRTLAAFLTFVTVIYLLHVPDLFEDPAGKTAWAVRYIVRTLCFPIWITLMVYLYRCLTSQWAMNAVNRYPQLFRVVASLAPVAILFTLCGSVRPVSTRPWLDYLYYPVVAYAVIVVIRFAVHLMRALFSKDFGWKEIFIGRE